MTGVRGMRMPGKPVSGNRPAILNVVGRGPPRMDQLGLIAGGASRSVTLKVLLWIRLEQVLWWARRYRLSDVWCLFLRQLQVRRWPRHDTRE